VMRTGLSRRRGASGTKCAAWAVLVLAAWASACAAAPKKNPNLDKYYNANALCRQGLFPLAIKDYEAFLRANPKHEKVPKAQWGLAICYYSVGEMAKAAGLFAKIAGNAQVPDQDQLHNLWGSCLVELGKSDEAVKAFEWTVKNGKKPKRKADALAGLTQAQFTLKNWAAAVQAGDALIKLAPGTPYIDTVRYQGAVARINLKKHAEAVAAFGGLIAASKDAELVHESTYQAAECLVVLKKLPDAIKMYESAALAKKGKFSELAHFNLGMLQFQTGEYEATIKTLRSFLNKYRESELVDEATLFMGRGYLESKKHREAISIFDGILRGLKGPRKKPRKKPRRGVPMALAISDSSVGARATLWIVRAYARGGQHQTARKLLEPVVGNYRNDPVSAELYYELAKADMETGLFATAAKNFAASAKGKDPLPMESLRLQAFCHYRAGNFHGSLPLCEAFLTKYPDSGYKAEVLFVKGEDLLAAKRLADAIPIFESALAAKLEPAKAKQSQLRIAQAYYHQKMWAKCIAALQPLLAMYPPDEDAGKKPRKPPRKKPSSPAEKLYDQIWFMAGDCCFRLEQWLGAISALEAFVQQQPNQPNVHKARYNLSLAYQKVEKPAGAIAALTPFLHVQKSEKAGEEALRVRALLDLGRLQYEAEDYKKAEASLRRVAGNPDAIYYLAWIAKKQGKDADAVKYFGEMAKHGGHSFGTDSALQRAVLQYRRGKYVEAEATLTALGKTLQRGPKAKDAHRIDQTFYLGLCQARLSKYDQAVRSFNEVVRRAPDSKRAPTALYWQAWCQKQRKSLQQAEPLYVAFGAKYPTHKLMSAVTFELAELRFHQRQQREKLMKTKVKGRPKRPPKTARQSYADIAESLKSLLAKDSKTPATGELRNRALYLLGWCLFKEDQMGPAAQAFETMIAAEEAAAKADKKYKISELVASACFQAGEARRRLKEFGPSKELFAKAARLRGGVGAGDRDDVLLRLAQLQAINSQWRESRQTAESLIKSFPESKLKYEAYFSVGWAWENEKKYHQAMGYYRKVIDANVKDHLSARAQFQIAECYFSQSQYDSAISEFNLVITKYGFDQWSSVAMLGMGRCFKAQGKKIQARSYFDDVILKYPKTTAAELAAKLIKTTQ